MNTDYRKGRAHKVFENLLQQEFCTPAINQKWCTDFTYLFLTDGRKRYNCSVLDLHDRSMIASITDKNITAEPWRKHWNPRLSLMVHEFCIVISEVRIHPENLLNSVKKQGSRKA